MRVIVDGMAGMAAAMVLALAAAASPPGAAAPTTSGIQTANIDAAVRPQDDLFGYANGTWLRNTPIPDDRSRYGVDTLMAERSLLQQRTLLEAARTASDADARKVGDLYGSFMDEERVERVGATPLQPELAKIAAIENAAEVVRTMARLGRIGISMPLENYVQPDAKQSTRYALYLTQGGLGLPDREYYVGDEPKFADIKEKYRAHVAAMLALLGERTAADDAVAIVALETRLAGVQWKPIDRRDPVKTYNPRTVDALRTEIPGIDWRGYLKTTGLRGTMPTLVARQPDYLAALSGIVRDTPVSVWKAYFRFRVLSASAPYLPRAYVDADFAFNEGVLRGTPRLADRWKRACALVNGLMGDASGKLYVAAHFPSQSKARIKALVDNLLRAYGDSIDRLDWLSPATRTQARAKLAKIGVRVGYPDRWRDYRKLVVRPDELLANVWRARAFETDRKYAQLAGPVDRDEWDMTAPTVDAGYNPIANTIEFPAGVLQPPLFDANADDAYNYGSTGATIGHEISHAFDNRGSRYDADGNLRNWWTPEDHAAFEARTAKLVAQFNAYEPLPGFHVDGALTLPENIADLAGLEIAYAAYVAALAGRPAPVIDGLTGDQRFFIGYAQSYLGKRRDASLIAQLTSNPHAPEKHRVDGIVVHLDAFYRAFAVTSNDKMYIAPEARVKLW